MSGTRPGMTISFEFNNLRHGRACPGHPNRHYAMDHDLTLKEAALKLGFVTEELFDRVVDPA
jgi:hypothetical protein